MHSQGMKSRMEKRREQKERKRERVSNPATLDHLVASYDTQGSYGEPILFTPGPKGGKKKKKYIYIYILLVKINAPQGKGSRSRVLKFGDANTRYWYVRQLRYMSPPGVCEGKKTTYKSARTT